MRAMTSDLAPGERWYCVQTLPHREEAAAAQLAAQGFRVFLPRLMRTVRHARRLRTLRRPAFPSYLFVALDLDRDRWRAVNGTRGVARLVMADDRPAPAPHGVVETLLELVDVDGLARFDIGLREGQGVRVLSGPLAEAMGRMLRCESGDRVRVLLDIMGGEICATLPRSALAAA